jgi:chemotaxis protein MotB
MSARQNAPVIIKRKKIVGGDGHHGGAWKVAYADFVTAMMAFFMLMWLLNATTEKQRKGIADYFNPTIPVNRISGGGDGAFGGDSVFSQDELPQNGYGAVSDNPTEQKQARGQTGIAPGQAEGESLAQNEAFATVEKALTANSGESMASDRALRHIVTRVTDEGLIVELYDLEDEPLFGPDGAPAPVLDELAGVLARVFALVANEVAVNGHTRAFPVVLAADPSWPLSLGRAASVRDLLGAHGLAPGRIQRVAGYADRRPAVANPAAVRNNRVEVILLRPGRG